MLYIFDSWGGGGGVHKSLSRKIPARGAIYPVGLGGHLSSRARGTFI